MKNNEVNSKRESSKLIRFIQDNYTHNESPAPWRKIYRNVVFDSDLKKNELLTYLAILKECYKVGASESSKGKLIWQSTIAKLANISKSNIGNPIKGLEDKGYITRQGSSYKITKKGCSKQDYLPIPISHFDGIQVDKTKYINSLKALLLSFGNDTLPTMRDCKNKMPKIERQQYKTIKSIRQGRSDVQIYESLQDLKVIKVNSSSSEELSVKVVDKIGLTKTTKQDEVLEVLELMGKIYNKEFSLSDNRDITFNILTKYSKGDILKVATYLKPKWDNDTMRVNLRPSTIFKEQYFKKYLEEAKTYRSGENLENAYLLPLKHREVIDNQVVENFIDDSYYHIFQYRTCKEGNMKGSGRRLCRLGKAIKILIRCMDTEEKFNATREFIYLYNKEETLNQVA